MFTSQAPYIFSALNGAMSGDDLRQLTQAFANCNQALDHRGFVGLDNRPMAQSNGAVTNLSGGGLPPWALGNQVGAGQTYPSGMYGGSYYGVDAQGGAQGSYRPGSDGVLRWANANPANYTNGSPFVFPSSGGGYTAGDWITYQGDNNYFDVAPRITETQNVYYGGPTFQVAGDSYYDNTVTNNAYITNVTAATTTTETLNDIPIDGPSGDPGDAGPGGAPGRPGNPGIAGPAGPAGANGLNGFNGVNGLNGFNGIGINGKQGRDGANGLNGQDFDPFAISQLKFGQIGIVRKQREIIRVLNQCVRYLRGLYLDTDTCDIKSSASVPGVI